MMTNEVPFEISVQDLQNLRTSGVNHTVLDVREPQELEMVSLEGVLAIPMNTIPENLEKLPKEGTLVVMCHHGPRSGQVTGWLREQGYDNATNLDGGIHQWAVEIDPEVGTY
jgi:rhodanese-related sulfurtransferase